MTNTQYTLHTVLAGAYKARSYERATLVHASANRGKTAVCGKVKADALADEYGTPPDITEPTCPHCRRRLGLK